jgi:hypothetical protein
VLGGVIGYPIVLRHPRQELVYCNRLITASEAKVYGPEFARGVGKRRHAWVSMSLRRERQVVGSEAIDFS